MFEDGEPGDRLPGSPEKQLSIFASYTYELTGGNTIVVDGGYAWKDDVLSLVGARGDSLTLDSYGRAALNVGYVTDTWSITGYVDNLFDEEYIEWYFGARFIGLPADIAWPSKPRQAGIEFSLRY